MLASIDIFLSNPDNLLMLGFISGIACLVLIFLGMTNSIIIFRNEEDFMLNLGMVLVPLFTILILIMLAPGEPDNIVKWSWETTQTKIVTVIGLGLTFYVISRTLKNCIDDNGLIFGPIVFAFKLCAAAICVVVAFGSLARIFEEKKSLHSLLLGLVVFGILAFFMRQLINGDAVEAKRANR